METNYKGMNVVRDLPGQVEFNRRKNVEQDQRLSTLSSQVADLLAQEPAGYLPEVFYGITQGTQTYRFNVGYEITIDDLTGTVGDSYELYDSSQSDAYIPAIAVQTDETTLKIIIKGDYPAYSESFTAVNMKTGDDYDLTLSYAVSTQDASYLGALNADNYKNKQITVLHDLESNKDNVLFCSIDLNSDEDYNWISIGSFTNGTDGKCVYSINVVNKDAILLLLKNGDSLVVCENMTIGSNSYLLGDVLTVNSINPLTTTKLGNIRGATGATGATGANGADGEDGETPEIVNGYWYIGGVNTGVKAVGTDGTNGQNGQSFQTQSGLYSVPANEGQTGNVDPDGNALLTLPTLPTTGITGKGYVVFDPLTTPLSPYYDLYWANDGDNDWTIIHPFSGIAGQDGEDGATPYIGGNNHWYIDGVDTGVTAVGQNGANGISFTYKGSWVGSQNAYNANDVVTYDGSSYICISNVAITVITPAADTTHWSLMVEKGDQGTPGANTGLQEYIGTSSSPIVLCDLNPGTYVIKGYIKLFSTGTTYAIRPSNSLDASSTIPVMVQVGINASGIIGPFAYDIFLFGAQLVDTAGMDGFYTLRPNKYPGSLYYNDSTYNMDIASGTFVTVNNQKTAVINRYVLGKEIPGGTTGQVLAKASNNNFDYEWITPASGGGSTLYRHLINISRTNNYSLSFELINSSSTALTTIANVTSAIENAGYTGTGYYAAGMLPCYGYYKNVDFYNITHIAYKSTPSYSWYFLASKAFSDGSFGNLFTTLSASSLSGTPTITDTVVQIS